MIKKLILLALLNFVLISCGEENSPESSKYPKDLFPKNILPCSDEMGESYTGGEFVLIRDVPYFGDLVGDLYLPSDRTNFPVAVHIHGGGWRGGSRRTPMAKWWGEFLACNGIAVFDIEYTLIPKAKNIMQQAKESKCAIVWTQTKGKEYGIGDKIIIFGGSAGGHLTSLVSLKEDIDISDCPWSKKLNGKIKISASIPFYGVYDFTEFFGKTIRSLLQLEENDLQEISPIFYAQNAYFPTLIIHGTSDFIPIEHALKFYRKLKEYGKDVELFVVEDGVHAFDVFPENKFTKITKEKIYDFLVKKNILTPYDSRPEPKYDHIKKAMEFLENGHFKHAYLEFSKAGDINCQTEYGKFLAISFDILSSLINAQDSSISIIPAIDIPSEAPKMKKFKELEEINTKNPDFNFYYENYIEPIVARLDKLERLGNYILENSCIFTSEKGVPLYLGVYSIKARIGKKFGPEFPLFFMSIINLTKSILFYIFSHDINLQVTNNLQKLLQKYTVIFSINQAVDPVGLIRDIAGLVYVENPNILNFKRPEILDGVKINLTKSLRYFSKYIEEAILNVSDNSDVFAVRDEDEDGRLSTSDRFYVGILKVEPSDSSHWFISLSNFLGILPFLGEDYFKRISRFFFDLGNIVENNVPINLGEFDKIIPDILINALRDRVGENIFPEFISFNIGGFLDSRKPLRDFLPEVVADIEIEDSTTKPVLLIESEIGKSGTQSDVFPNKDYCYVCLSGERFKRYNGVNSYDGKTISSIQDDFISLDEKFLFQNIGILYAYYKDPTFAGNLFVYESNLFVEPDVFLLNKAIAIIFTRIEKIFGSFLR